MLLRRFGPRAVRALAVGSAAAAGVPAVVSQIHLHLTAQYGNTAGSWADGYRSFLAGTESLTLLTLLQPATVLLAVTFVHAVWQRSLTVVTLFGVAAATGSGLTVTLPPSLTPLATQLCPVCVVSTGVEVPAGALVVTAAVLCNLSELLRQGVDTRHAGRRGRDTDESLYVSLLATRRQSGRLLSKLSGYALAVSFLAVGVGSLPSIEILQNIGGVTAGGLVICALVVYELVATGAAYSLGVLAALAWLTGIAALQYDTALSGVLLPTAVLLTVSTTTSFYAERIAPAALSSNPAGP